MTAVDKYPKEIDPAQKLFWEKMLESAKNTTKTKIFEEILKIKQSTEDLPWLSKFVANVFKSGAGEAEKKYPSRKR
jgi:hypothetical protein